MINRNKIPLVIPLLAALLVSETIGFAPNFIEVSTRFGRASTSRISPSSLLRLSETSGEKNDSSQTKEQEQPSAPAPILNGKRVLPYKVMSAGLKGHKVAGVYAVLNSSYKRGYVQNLFYLDTHVCRSRKASMRFYFLLSISLPYHISIFSVAVCEVLLFLCLTCTFYTSFRLSTSCFLQQIDCSKQNFAYCYLLLFDYDSTKSTGTLVGKVVNMLAYQWI